MVVVGETVVGPVSRRTAPAADDPLRAAMAGLQLSQCRRRKQLETAHRVVSVDLGDIQGAHELDDVLGDDLPGHDPGGTQAGTGSRNWHRQVETVHEPIGEVGAVEKQMFAVRAVYAK